MNKPISNRRTNVFESSFENSDNFKEFLSKAKTKLTENNKAEELDPSVNISARKNEETVTLKGKRQPNREDIYKRIEDTLQNKILGQKKVDPKSTSETLSKR